MNSVDPLAGFRAGAFTSQGSPIPLIATGFDVTLAAGLAVVEVTRRFRNAEEQAIEATITFPVPVHAVMFRLRAVIGELVLEGRVQLRAAARDTYEDGIRRGKASVLHEEVLRGVHMLSVGQIAPGAEVEVTIAWVMIMPMAGGVARLRIPLTVGDIYGRSSLPDSDALVTGGPGGVATLSVSCLDGCATLRGQSIIGPLEIPLDRPIDLAVQDWTPRALLGRTAAGHWLALTVTPLPENTATLDVAVVVDRSSSMATSSDANQPGMSLHDSVRATLSRLGASLRDGDAVDLWEFDDTATMVGTTREGRGNLAKRMMALAKRLGPPRGGTEIGAAMETVLSSTTSRDVLLVTDGCSYALDAAALAHRAAGRRVSVLLVGESSLEAQVGHLAALTGGEVAVATTHDVGALLEATLRAMPSVLPPTGDGIFVAVRGHAAITVAEAAPGTDADALLPRAVAAVVAGLRLASLSPDAAAALAEAEGLVTAATSLVLVDEEGAVQEGVPAQRKVALPTPATASRSAVWSASERRPAAFRMEVNSEPYSVASSAWRTDWAMLDPAPPENVLAALVALFAHLPLDWDANPSAVVAGDLSALPSSLADAVRWLAIHLELCGLAARLGMAPERLAILLLARAQAKQNRTAARLARLLLPKGVKEMLPFLPKLQRAAGGQARPREARRKAIT